jgi:hypothetical protein
MTESKTTNPDLNCVIASVLRLQSLTDQYADVMQSIVMHPAEQRRLENSILVAQRDPKWIARPPKICGVLIEVNDRLPEHIIQIKTRDHTYLLDLMDGQVKEMFEPKEMFCVR